MEHEDKKFRLKIDVEFNEDEIDDMVDGLRGLIRAVVAKVNESKETTTLMIPLGTLSVHIQ